MKKTDTTKECVGYIANWDAYKQQAIPVNYIPSKDIPDKIEVVIIKKSDLEKKLDKLTKKR